MTQAKHQPMSPMPQQRHEHSGIEAKKSPRPEYLAPQCRGAMKLLEKAPLITGGDFGIGRSWFILRAKVPMWPSYICQSSTPVLKRLAWRCKTRDAKRS